MYREEPICCVAHHQPSPPGTLPSTQLKESGLHRRIDGLLLLNPLTPPPPPPSCPLAPKCHLQKPPQWKALIAQPCSHCKKPGSGAACYKCQVSYHLNKRCVHRCLDVCTSVILCVDNAFVLLCPLRGLYVGGLMPVAGAGVSVACGWVG